MKSVLVATLMFLCISCSEKTQHKLHIVEIKGMKFTPAEILVSPGDTILWINRDIVAHDVTELKTRSWHSGALKTGASWSKVVNNSDDYFCSIHVVMTGKIKVN